MFSLFHKKPKQSNAFSFGEECVRFISLERTDQGVSVNHHTTLQMQGIVDIDGIILDDAKFVERIREFSKTYKVTTATIVVPDCVAIFFHTHVAKMPPKEMDDVITDHLKTYCESHDLLALGEYVCEYDIINETSSGYDIHVTLAPKSIVLHIARLFKQAGVDAPNAETAHHAVSKTCLALPNGLGYVAISVGNKKTTVSLIHGEHLVSHDIVDVGIESIAHAIIHRLHISHDEAMRIIARHGVMLSHPDKTVLSDIHQVLAPIIRSVDKQIILNLEKQYKLFGERFAIQKVVVYGVGLSVKGMVDYLGQGTRFPAVALDVWADSGTKHVSIMKLPASDVPVYAEALSAAIGYLAK